MKRWKAADIIVLGLVFILIMMVSGLVMTKILSPNEHLMNENLDLILAFSGTIVTGILMYVTKNKEL